MTNSNQIQVWFGPKSISNAEVLAWEVKRATRGLHKFGVPVPAGDPVLLRKTLADAKLAMGREAIEQRLAGEIRISDRFASAIVRASRGRRRISQVEIFAPGAKANQMPAWYFEKVEADDELVFLEATPDHHIFRTFPDHRGQEVWETTGGSPIASRFFFELDVTEGLVTPADPTYPVQMTGSARLANGTLIGGIRHQFRDEKRGTRALLTVEFPWLMGPIGPAAHRWHLASEFSAWIKASATTGD